MPGSGPVSTRSSPIRRLNRVDLPAFGRPDDRERHRPVRHFGSGFFPGFGRPFQVRPEGKPQVAHPQTVFGGNCQRLPQAEAEGVETARLGVPALAFVGEQQDGGAGAAQQVGESAGRPA